MRAVGLSIGAQPACLLRKKIPTDGRGIPRIIDLRSTIDAPTNSFRKSSGIRHRAATVRERFSGTCSVTEPLPNGRGSSGVLELVPAFLSSIGAYPGAKSDLRLYISRPRMRGTATHQEYGQAGSI